MLKAYNRHWVDSGKDPAVAGTLAAFVHAHLGMDVRELTEYANAYVPRGEKLVAASTYSMLNDRYYGQWVVLHRPFRDIEELQAAVAGELAKVPAASPTCPSQYMFCFTGVVKRCAYAGGLVTSKGLRGTKLLADE